MSLRQLYAFQDRLWAQYVGEKDRKRLDIIGEQMARNFRAIVKAKSRRAGGR